MIIKTVQHFGNWVTQITQGHQRFYADFYGTAGWPRGSVTQEEAKNMSRMFRTALKAHDAEVIERYFKGDAR